MLKHDTIHESSYAVLYNNLGNAYTVLKQYHLGLGYYNASLEKKLNIYQTLHPSIATTYKSIAYVYGCMNNIPQAQENYKQAANIYRQLYSDDDPTVKEIEGLIRNLTDNTQNS